MTYEEFLVIRIERDRRDEQGHPIRPSSDWFRRALKATNRAISEGAAHVADSKIYAAAEVRAALEKLFSDKCAYCESEATASHDWNVEHYRPKGKVEERPDHPGYYWLAYEWANLHLSCQLCNQLRRDRRSWDDPTLGPTLGKADHFPLGDEATRAMGPEMDYLDENTLLIDPCWDEPRWYLTVGPSGDMIALDDNEYGKASIDYCNLNRKPLKRLRRKKVEAAVRALRGLRKAKKSGKSEAVAEVLEFIDTHLLDSSCSYAAAARAVVACPGAFNV